jgi:hypothetical protein
MEITDDMPIRGVAAIARFRNEPMHRTYRGLELGHIPGFKEGGVWHLRPSTQAAHHAKLEEDAARAAAERRARRDAPHRGRRRPRVQK